MRKCDLLYTSFIPWVIFIIVAIAGNVLAVSASLTVIVIKTYLAVYPELVIYINFFMIPVASVVVMVREYKK